MSKTIKRTLGDLGEDIASKYLVKRGYVVVGRNYLKPWGEIDVVAMKEKSLHFIEVKTVSCEIGDSLSHETAGFGLNVQPEENMHQKKIRRIIRAAHTYMTEESVSEEVEWGIDLVCVFLDVTRKTARVRMYENIAL